MSFSSVWIDGISSSSDDLWLLCASSTIYLNFYLISALSGPDIAGLAIVLFSTPTNAFLRFWSARDSFRSCRIVLWRKVKNLKYLNLALRWSLDSWKISSSDLSRLLGSMTVPKCRLALFSDRSIKSSRIKANWELAFGRPKEGQMPIIWSLCAFEISVSLFLASTLPSLDLEMLGVVRFEFRFRLEMIS